MLIALVGLLLLPQVAAAYTIVETYDSDGNGWIDTWTVDDNADGPADRLLMDVNSDGSSEVVGIIDPTGNSLSAIYVDANNNWRYDALLLLHRTTTSLGAASAGLSIYLDRDENGAWEVGYYDGQDDGIFEWLHLDTTGDGVADFWQANVAPAGHSAADEAARHVAAVSSLQILAAGNVPIFGPGTIYLP